MDNVNKIIAEAREKVRQFEERILKPEDNWMEIDFVQGSELSGTKERVVLRQKD